MSFSFVDPWHLFLPGEGGHVVGLMGSGGKTSLMRVFADVYRKRNLPTVMTTTTRCEKLADVPAITWSPELPESRDLPGTFFLTAGDTPDGKWQGITPRQCDRLGEIWPDRVTLVEVDGAAKHPVKLHRSGEPCWPGRTSLAVVVMGASAVGDLVGTVLHRFGQRPFPPADPLASDDVLEWDHLIELLLADDGYLHQVPAGVPALLALTGLGDVEDSVGLFDFVGRAMADERLPLTVFCELDPERLSLRTACRLDEAGPEQET